MSFLVDFHTHFFSRPFFEALGSQSPKGDASAETLERVVAEAGVELPPDDLDEHLGRWLGEMERHGVQHMVSFASVPEEAATVASAAARTEGRLTPFSVVDPRREEAPERVEAWLSEHGFRGVVLFPALHRYSIDGPDAARVLAVVERHAAIAVVHCGLFLVKLRDLFGLPRAHDLWRADPLRLVPAADQHPGATFVIPHFGAGLFRETLMAGAQCPNVLVDTSSSNSWVKTQVRPLALPEIFERTLEVFGPERILFGTDSSVFPRGWRHDLFVEQTEALGACGASDDDRRAILGENARRVLNL